ncbi:hypothetical protein EBZ39_01860 [bacterium]|nr:hypothetical protein [bacterium]
MSTSKKVSVDSVREEMRVLNAAAADAADVATTLHWSSPDFWTMVSAAVTNVISVLVLIGWIQASNVQELTAALTALVGATQVIVVNSVLVWKYLSGRNELKARMLDSQYQYMAMVAVEKLRTHS